MPGKGERVHMEDSQTGKGRSRHLAREERVDELLGGVEWLLDDQVVEGGGEAQGRDLRGVGWGGCVERALWRRSGGAAAAGGERGVWHRGMAGIRPLLALVVHPETPVTRCVCARVWACGRACSRRAGGANRGSRNRGK
jgi:hypothetical protein